jgi:hypothetical protein
MIPDNVFIRVSFFLAQRPLPPLFQGFLRCHSTWLNARAEAVVFFTHSQFVVKPD